MNCTSCQHRLTVDAGQRYVPDGENETVCIPKATNSFRRKEGPIQRTKYTTKNQILRHTFERLHLFCRLLKNE